MSGVLQCGMHFIGMFTMRDYLRVGARGAEGGTLSGLLELLDESTVTDSKLLELSTFAQVDCGDRAKVGQSKRLHSLLKTELIPFVGIGGGPPALFRVCSFPSLQCGTTLKSSNK